MGHPERVAFFVACWQGGSKHQARVYDLHSQNPDGTFIGTRTDMIADNDGTHNMLSIPLWGDVWQANGKTFVVIPACPDHGMATYELTVDGELELRDSVTDGQNAGYLFKETMLADVMQIDGQHYILVSGTQNSGISMFRVDDNGQMEWVESVTDTSTTSFNSYANYAFTTTDDGSVVMVTAGSSENSITVFELDYEEPPIDQGVPVLPDVA